MLFYRTFPALHYLGECKDDKHTSNDDGKNQHSVCNKDQRYDRDKPSHAGSEQYNHDDKIDGDKYQNYEQKHKIDAEKYKFELSGSKRKSSESSASLGDKSKEQKSTISFKLNKKVYKFIYVYISLLQNFQSE